MAWNDYGIMTFTANGAIPNRARVKVTSESATRPIQVEVAGAGEQHVGIAQYAAGSGEVIAVRLRQAPGTQEGIAADSFPVGAILYGAASGRITDSASGTAIGIALEAATAAGDIVKFIDFTVISTTAATISIADQANIITGTTVEAALAEIMTGIKTTQYQLQPDFICLEDGTAITKFADGAYTTPGFTQINNKDVGIRWNNHSTPGELCFHFTLPQDLDDTADIVVHLLGTIIKAGAEVTDSPVCSVEAYFSGVGDGISGDTNCGGDTTEFTADGTLEEATLTIAATDVPASPQSLTLLVNPKDGQLGTDDFFLSALWIECKRKCLTA